jgi:hypothetical protein
VADCREDRVEADRGKLTRRGHGVVLHVDHQFVLLQRGHGGGAPNASVRYPARDVLAWLEGRAREPAPLRIGEHRLPRIDGVPLTFTDGTALADGRWLFTAVAEATDDSIADGACVGSAVGLMNAQGDLQALWRLQNDDKVEGIAARERGGRLDLALVTDADDPAQPSRLLLASLSAP